MSEMSEMSEKVKAHPLFKLLEQLAEATGSQDRLASAMKKADDEYKKRKCKTCSCEDNAEKSQKSDKSKIVFEIGKGDDRNTVYLNLCRDDGLRMVTVTATFRGRNQIILAFNDGHDKIVMASDVSSSMPFKLKAGEVETY